MQNLFKNEVDNLDSFSMSGYIFIYLVECIYIYIYDYEVYMID